MFGNDLSGFSRSNVLGADYANLGAIPQSIGGQLYGSGTQIPHGIGQVFGQHQIPNFYGSQFAPTIWNQSQNPYFGGQIFPNVNSNVPYNVGAIHSNVNYPFQYTPFNTGAQTMGYPTYCMWPQSYGHQGFVPQFTQGNIQHQQMNPSFLPMPIFTASIPYANPFLGQGGNFGQAFTPFTGNVWGTQPLACR